MKFKPQKGFARSDPTKGMVINRGGGEAGMRDDDADDAFM